jgi:hypothetical protein
MYLFIYLLTHSFTQSLIHSLTYLLTPLSSVLFQKLNCSQLIRKLRSFPHFMETQSSLPNLQVLATYPYPEQ